MLIRLFIQIVVQVLKLSLNVKRFLNHIVKKKYIYIYFSLLTYIQFINPFVDIFLFVSDYNMNLKCENANQFNAILMWSWQTGRDVVKM